MVPYDIKAEVQNTPANNSKLGHTTAHNGGGLLPCPQRSRGVPRPEHHHVSFPAGAEVRVHRWVRPDHEVHQGLAEDELRHARVQRRQRQEAEGEQV